MRSVVASTPAAVNVTGSFWSSVALPDAVVEKPPVLAVTAPFVPLAVTSAPDPIHASVFFSITPMPPANPTATAPAPLTLAVTRSTSVSSSADTTTLPSAVAVASPIHALVVSDNTDTPAVTATAATPLAAPEMDTDTTRVVFSAWTTTEWPALTLAPSPMEASVRSVATPTSAPTPTPALPPKANDPAAPMSVASVVATTFTEPAVLMPAAAGGVAPTGVTRASAVSSMTVTVTEPATPAVPAAAPAMAKMVICGVEVASTVTPLSASTSARPDTDAVVRLTIVALTTEAPTPAAPAPANDPATDEISASLSAATVTLPWAETVESPVICAVAVLATTSTVTDAPTAAGPPAPAAPRETTNMDASSSADTVTDPPAPVARTVEESITASTVLVMTLTAIEAPTAAVPPLKANPPDHELIDDSSSAVTRALPADAVTVDPATSARTVLVMTFTEKLPPSATPLIEAAAPTEADTILPFTAPSGSVAVASTVTEPAETVEPSIDAVTSTWSML